MKKKENCSLICIGLKIPVVFISSRDDPLIPEQALPIEECKKNKNTILILTKRGGHVGFSEGLIPIGKNWVDHLIIDLLGVLKENLQEQCV